MRKRIVVTVVLAVLLALAGCATTPRQTEKDHVSEAALLSDPVPFATPEKLTDQLELISLGYGEAEGIGGVYPCVEGIVHNISDKTVGYVEIDINYFDKQGNQVQSSVVNTTNLAPEGKWLFKDSIIYTGYDSFKIVNVRWSD